MYHCHKGTDEDQIKEVFLYFLALNVEIPDLVFLAIVARFWHYFQNLLSYCTLSDGFSDESMTEKVIT